MRFTVENGLDDLILLGRGKRGAWLVTVEPPDRGGRDRPEHLLAAFLQGAGRKRRVRYTQYLTSFKPTLEDYFIMLAKHRDGNAGGEEGDPAARPTPPAGNGRASGS